MTTTSRALPDGDTLEKASKLNVFDSKGEKVSFGSIIDGQKTVVVFIRASTSPHQHQFENPDITSQVISFVG